MQTGSEMANEKILVVDDEADICELVEYNLAKNGYRTSSAHTGEKALREARSGSPDLIILDLMLPGVSGLEVCKHLKRDEKTSEIPIIMLTAKGSEVDIVSGLELGADDYVTKPFSPKELVARVKAVLRRKGGSGEGGSEIITRGNIVIDRLKHEVTVKGSGIELTRTEFDVLVLLARRPGFVFTRYGIIDAVQGDRAAVTDRSVDVHIVSLRRKLGSAGDSIDTVRGIGYRFKE